MTNETSVDKASSVHMQEVSAEFVLITPAMARQALDKSEIKNRDWRPSNMKALVEAMLRGKFMLNGQAIIFDDRNNILDGHHRLEACIKADVEFRTLVVRGVDRSAMATIDTGAARTIADELTLISPAHRIINRRVGAIMQLILMYAKPVLPPYFRTVPGRKEILDSDPEIMEAAACLNVPKTSVVRESVIGAMKYLGSIAHRDETDRFIKQLIDGAGLHDGDPAYTVREYLIAVTKRTSSTRTKMGNWEVFRACCLGLERFINNQQLKIVRVSKRPNIPGADPKMISRKLGIDEASE